MSTSRLLLSASPFNARFISSTMPREFDSVETNSAEPVEKPVLDPETVHTRKEERLLLKHYGKSPIGSRRRRAAMATNAGVLFEQLPYQCFQEARKVLAEHRDELLEKIKSQSDRIARLKEQKVDGKDGRRNAQLIQSLARHVHDMVIEADSRDPIVVKTFEDGQGDLNKPIYRYLADQKWREYKRKIVLQRITQMFVTPDVLPEIDPVASVEIKFSAGTKVEPGQFVDSRLSQFAPSIAVKVFDAGPRLVTVVFVDSDVPNMDTDDFDHRCHGIFSNIEIDPTTLPIKLRSQKFQEAVKPWIPPTAQKGSPYHRISAWVLRHAEPLDAEELRTWVSEMEKQTKGFSMRAFVEKTGAKPVGVTMFRTQWDEGMHTIMKRYNIPGADLELKRRRPEKLPYVKKDSKRYR